jgi:hypothetical protein
MSYEGDEHSHGQALKAQDVQTSRGHAEYRLENGSWVANPRMLTLGRIEQRM